MDLKKPDFKKSIDKITDLGIELMSNKNPDISLLGTLLLTIPMSSEKEEDMDEIISIIFDMINRRKSLEEKIKKLIS